MRFLHTADWHLGRRLRGRDRTAEFEAVLAEVVDIARREQVEAMLVCGDIYDAAQPSPEAERLLYETLRECVGIPIQVVLLASNHDSPRKLQALGRLSDLLGVYTQGFVLPPDDGGVITLQGAEHRARIAAIPWIHEGRLIDAERMLALDGGAQLATYADRCAEVYRAMCAGFEPDAVNILCGHIFVDEAQLADIDGSERLLHIGQAYGVTAQALPSTPQYMALGHIHQPQEIANAANGAATYAGSLLQLDFGEREQQKIVRVIDVEPGRPARHHAVPLSAGRSLIELRGTLAEVTQQAQALPEAHLRIVLDLEQPEHGIAQRVRDAVPNVIDVRLEYERSDEPQPVPSLAQLAPRELFARYYHAQHGAPPPVELVALFAELLDESLALEGSPVADASPVLA